MFNPINFLAGFLRGTEAKVKAASTAAAVAGLVLSLLAQYVFRGATPEWVTAPVDAVVAGGLAYTAGWLAKHTPGNRTKPPVEPPNVTPAAPSA